MGSSNALRRLSQLHEHDAVVAWWQARSTWISSRLTPERRRALLSLAAIGVAWRGVVTALPHLHGLAAAPRWLVVPAALAIVLGLLYGAYLAAVHFARLPSVVRARPQVALHVAFWSLLGLVWLIAA